MERRIADINEMIDIMSSIKGGVFATVCYMNSAKIGKTLTGKGIDIDQFGRDLDDNRTEGDDEIYTNLKNYQSGGANRKNKFPYAGIVKMSTYQFNWQSEDNYGRNFNKYATKRDELLSKYGAAIDKRDFKHDEKINFGSGVSVGATDNTKGKLYAHQNGATIQNAKSEYFIVDNDGELKGGISFDAIKQLVTKNNQPDGVSALKKIGASDEQIREYIQELKKLNFRVLKLMYDSILFIVATVNNEKIVFINNNLAKTIGSGAHTLDINPQSFIQIANQMYNKSVNEMKECSKRYNIFRNMINESVKRILREGKESTREANKLIKHLYNAVNRVTHGFYRDDAWQGVNDVLKLIDTTIGDNGELSVWCENGGYAKPIGEEGNYKTWKIRIELFNGGIIGGELNANAAGTHQDPFGRYDITCSFWRE